jgi:hypothetical protein
MKSYMELMKSSRDNVFLKARIDSMVAFYWNFGLTHIQRISGMIRWRIIRIPDVGKYVLA